VESVVVHSVLKECKKSCDVVFFFLESKARREAVFFLIIFPLVGLLVCLCSFLRIYRVVSMILK